MSTVEIASHPAVASAVAGVIIALNLLLLYDQGL